MALRKHGTNDRGAVRADDATMVHDSAKTHDGDRMHDSTRTHDTTGRRDEVDLRSKERRGAEMRDPRDHVDRQHDSFGGFKWGAAFFGWLSANGLTVLLLAIASAAGVAFGITQIQDTQEAATNAEEIGIAGAIVLLVILALGYYAGGYVAGRMARFDGARQGFGVWLIGLLVVIALAVAGAVAGAEYNVLSEMNLPRIPVDEGDVATGAGIAALVGILGSLLAAMAGGKAGERYHRKVDRVAIDPRA
jgi:hypothetical protein